MRKRYAWYSGQDSWSMGLDEASGTLFAVGFPTAMDVKRCQWGGTHLYALDVHTGKINWAFKFKECNCNLMAAVVGRSVIFSDDTGNTYSLDLQTGKPNWIVPGFGKTFTTGTAAVGENGLVFTAANRNDTSGAISAFEVKTGKLRWQRNFPFQANNAPATYRDRNGRQLVVMGISNNAGFPLPWMEGKETFKGTVYAVDAETGEDVWAFSPPEWKHAAAAGSTMEEICLPDAFTNPSVDASGTVYIGWMGGFVYAIDGTTGKLLSQWETASGMQGAPAVADGMLVVTSCLRMAGFVKSL